MLHPLLPLTWTVLVDIVAWGVIHAVTGYAAHRLPDRRLTRDGWLLRPRSFETDGRWYRTRLHIDRWKDSLPEAGDLFTGGVSKRHLPGIDHAGLSLSSARPDAPNWRTGGRWPARHSSSSGTRL